MGGKMLPRLLPLGAVQEFLRHTARHRRDVRHQVSVSVNDLQPVCHGVYLLACTDAV